MRYTPGPLKIVVRYAEGNEVIVGESAFVIILATLVVRTFLPHRAPKGARLLPGPSNTKLDLQLDSHVLGKLAFSRRIVHLGYPVVGNLLSIPPKHSWLQFKEWADEYGTNLWPKTW